MNAAVPSPPGDDVGVIDLVQSPVETIPPWMGHSNNPTDLTLSPMKKQTEYK